MKSNTNVISLGCVRDLLGEWQKVRDALASTKLTGFSLTLRGPDGAETIYLGGIYKDDAREAARASLRMTMARMLSEDDQLPKVGT